MTRAQLAVAIYNTFGATEYGLTDYVDGDESTYSGLNDLPTHDDERKAVIFVLKNTLMFGTGEATFSPENGVSRAQLCTVLYRLLGMGNIASQLPEKTSEISFDDVTETTVWYYNAVMALAKAEVVANYGDSHFGVDEPATLTDCLNTIDSLAAAITLN